MNNDQTNPWISISDLLSSVVVVLLLMLIFTIISNRVEQKRNRETIFNEISSTLKSYEENGYLILDINNYVIQLSDITFETASACISNDYKQILETISQSLGYGDTRLNDQLDPISKKNRRIEIRLLFVDHLNL